MQLTLSGIPIEVQKKDIKNLHLSVKPPYTPLSEKLSTQAV